MTVTSQTTKVTTTGNGSSFVFSFSPMVIFASTDIVVTSTVIATGVETTLVEGTGATKYSVGITTYPATGSITYPQDQGTPIADTIKITIKRVLTLEQQTDLSNQGGYFADTQEKQFDKQTMMTLQQQEDIDRSFAFPISYSGGASTEIPVPTAGTPLAWNAAGTALENSASSTLQPLSATLTALAAYDTAGLVTQTSTSTFAGRTLTGTANKVTVTNGNGVSGNPTLTLPDAVTLVTPTVSGLSTHGGNIVSDTDSTDDLGTTSVRWRKLWVDDVQATTTLSADGLITGGSVALASGATITAFLDDDSMSANSATAGATQQSIKAYVDTLVSTNGGNWKASVFLASAVGANTTLSGVQTVDGVSATVGKRVLVKDQSTASQNGIYVVASGTWARSADANTIGELASAAVFVEEGGTFADTSFICTNDKDDSLGSTSIVWTQFGVGGGGGGWLGEGTTAPEGNSGDIIRINQQVLNNSVTMVATDNGSATGPLTIASGKTITISSGATFKVL